MRLHIVNPNTTAAMTAKIAATLGCAGMANLAGELAEEHDLPVIDGIAASEALGRLGLKTSRLGAYAAPRQKAYSGPFAPFQP